MGNSIDRLSNLIRVLKNVPDDKFNIQCWWSDRTGCGCAIGHALHDKYFYKEGMRLDSHMISNMAEFFGITLDQSQSLFLGSGYQKAWADILSDSDCKATPHDVIAKLRVILIEKRAHEPMFRDWVARELEDA
jgi:hypothetical protein